MKHSTIRSNLAFVLGAITIMVSSWTAPEGQMTQAAKAPTEFLIEVREGGYRERQPHSTVIKVYLNGLIETPRGKRQVRAEEVLALAGQLKSLGAFTLQQQTLEKEMVAAGDVPGSARGGSGVVTLVLAADPEPMVISLNQPDSHRNSTARSVQIFLSTWDLVKDFARTRQ